MEKYDLHSDEILIPDMASGADGVRDKIIPSSMAVAVAKPHTASKPASPPQVNDMLMQNTRDGVYSHTSIPVKTENARPVNTYTTIIESNPTMTVIDLSKDQLSFDQQCLNYFIGTFHKQPTADEWSKWLYLCHKYGRKPTIGEWNLYNATATHKTLGASTTIPETGDGGTNSADIPGGSGGNETSPTGEAPLDTKTDEASTIPTKSDGSIALFFKNKPWWFYAGIAAVLLGVAGFLTSKKTTIKK